MTAIPERPRPPAPRGVRLRNPMLVRKTAIEWRGEIPSLDDGFEAFATTEDGFRAGAMCLITSYRVHGLQTVWDLVKRHAPPEDDNPTSAYAKFVAGKLRLDVRTPFPVDSPFWLERLCAAIARFECAGHDFPPSVIHAGVQRALADWSPPK